MSIASKILMSVVLLAGAGTAAATTVVRNPGFEQGVLAREDDNFGGAFGGQLLDPTPGKLSDTNFWVRSLAGNRRIPVSWDGDKHVLFDDYSVVQVAAPPPMQIAEPDIYGLMLAALGTMLTVQRRRW